MKLIITTIEAASAAGISPFGHKTSPEGEILLNEMELSRNPRLSGSTEERAQQLSGRIFSKNEAASYINKNNFALWHKEKQ